MIQQELPVYEPFQQAVSYITFKENCTLNVKLPQCGFARTVIFNCDMFLCKVQIC
jgi:hypothetical protein